MRRKGTGNQDLQLTPSEFMKEHNASVARGKRIMEQMRMHQSKLRL